MPRSIFDNLFRLTTRSTRAVMQQGVRPPVSQYAPNEALYRYTFYYRNMPQPEDAGRVQRRLLGDDLDNRWTGLDPTMAGPPHGQQGVYFSGEFLDQNVPFPELNHYQDPAGGGPADSTDLISYYDYNPTPAGGNPIAPDLHVNSASNLRSMFMFTTNVSLNGADLRLYPQPGQRNPFLEAVHQQMQADREYNAVRNEIMAAPNGGFDIGDLDGLYKHASSADFCRPVGIEVLSLADVDHLLVTSVRDGVSPNVVIKTPPRIAAADPTPVVDVLRPQGRATFFVTDNGAVGSGVFTVADMLYNARFEPAGAAYGHLPPVDEFVARLTDVQQRMVEGLQQRVANELAHVAPGQAMDDVVAAIGDVQTLIAGGDVAATNAALVTLDQRITVAEADTALAIQFRTVLNHSKGCSASVGAMNQAIQDAQDNADGGDEGDGGEIEDPDPGDMYLAAAHD